MLKLNFKKAGAGRPLIILHGFLGSLDNWQSLSGAWAEQGIEVFSVDLRNHGRSPHSEHHSIDLMVQDVVDFMNQQSLTSASILGHSMGGKVAMQFALAHPEMTDKLIVADMAPRSYPPGQHDNVFAAIRGVDLASVHTRKEADAAMQAFLGDFGTRQFVLKSLYRDEETGRFAWRFNVDTLIRDYAEILKKTTADQPFEGETLFLKGALSLYIQEKDRSDIMTLFPKAQIETIDQAGHWLHADQPAAFGAAVSGFLLS